MRIILIFITLQLIFITGPAFSQSSNLQSEYSQAIQDPLLRHIRVVLDESHGADSSICTLTGLRGVSKASCSDFLKVAVPHAKSKFFALQGGRGLGGGKEYVVVFKDNLSQFYQVWVYEKADKEKEVRSFDKLNVPASKMTSVLAELKEVMSEDKYWM